MVERNRVRLRTGRSSAKLRTKSTKKPGSAADWKSSAKARTKSAKKVGPAAGWKVVSEGWNEDGEVRRKVICKGKERSRQRIGFG